MTIRDNTVRLSDFGYRTCPHGPNAGKPEVYLKLSKSDQNQIDPGTLDGKFSQYNWNKKLKNGFANLRVFGNDPLSEEHRDVFEVIDDIINPRFLHIELSDSDITEVPNRYIQNMVDSFSLFVPFDGSYDDEAKKAVEDELTRIEANDPETAKRMDCQEGFELIYRRLQDQGKLDKGSSNVDNDNQNNQEPQRDTPYAQGSGNAPPANTGSAPQPEEPPKTEEEQLDWYKKTNQAQAGG